ncbi:MAG: hypothetical protein IT178_01845 [Acidobacteria bacterium]|nr:hypothetical protein [Acidobacteriota bacterium]
MRTLSILFCAFFLSPSLASAQPGTSRGERAWIDVNLGAAIAAEDTFTTVLTSLDSGGEERRSSATYDNPTGVSFDFGGGYMFTPIIGVGASLVGTAHMAEAELFTRQPHPLLFNRFGEDTSTTDEELTRSEGSINFHAMVRLPIENDRLRVRFFGGPTYFRVQQELVTAIRYSQVYNGSGLNTIDITTYDADEFEATGWGFHAGGDVSYFFNDLIGVGGVARFSRGTVEFDDLDILSDDIVEVKAGGFQIAGGVRFRF